MINIWNFIIPFVPKTTIVKLSAAIFARFIANVPIRSNRFKRMTWEEQHKFMSEISWVDLTGEFITPKLDKQITPEVIKMRERHK